MLFAGEAAGFQDALWGFGMRHAMLSGHLAAQALLARQPEQYDRLWKKRLGGLMRTAVVNRLIYERLGDIGYSAIMRRFNPATDLRAWLRVLYGRSLWKGLLFPLARKAAATRASRKEVVCEWRAVIALGATAVIMWLQPLQQRQHRDLGSSPRIIGLRRTDNLTRY
jgi:hypothetical protein